MERHPKHIAIVGAGLVGSLFSIFMARRGYEVSVFERRGAPGVYNSKEGRSINLALSTRGIRALEEVGLAKEIKASAIPMHGRMMHDLQGNLTFQPYGKEEQFINSISRADLNYLLIRKAEKHNVRFHFGHRCVHTDLQNTSATFISNDNTKKTLRFDVVIGADGAFSAVRSAMQVTDRFNYSQHFLEHGYKELHIPPLKDGAFVMEKNALHIWPRDSFMMIALPNPGGSFTCTLFFPFEGNLSFAALDHEDAIRRFFDEQFPDAVPHMPELLGDFNHHPASSLVTVSCFPWVRNKTLLIGDAAHAIVPFYGQGMNAGFEDCLILNRLLDTYGDRWDEAAEAFQHTRKEDADAIASLASENFIEMRDLVADREFLLRKKIEARLHELFPEKWIPLYSMVTFHESIRYSDARRIGKKQQAIMDDVMNIPDIQSKWQELDFAKIVSRLS